MLIGFSICFLSFSLWNPKNLSSSRTYSSMLFIFLFSLFCYSWILLCYPAELQFSFLWCLERFTMMIFLLSAFPPASLCTISFILYLLSLLLLPFFLPFFFIFYPFFSSFPLLSSHFLFFLLFCRLFLSSICFTLCLASFCFSPPELPDVLVVAPNCVTICRSRVMLATLSESRGANDDKPMWVCPLSLSLLSSLTPSHFTALFYYDMLSAAPRLLSLPSVQLFTKKK